MATIANNHLSVDSLTGGRGGDSMFRLVDGEMSHVNPVEASIIDAFGKKGEDEVKKRGSDTINPYTGNREFFNPGTALAVAQFGISQYGAYQGVKQGREQADIQLGYLGDQKDALMKSQDDLSEAKKGRETAIQAQFQFDLEGLSAQTGQSTEDLMAGYNENIRKSGLATSGSIEQKKSTMWNRIQSSFEKGREGLFGQMGQKMGEVEGWFEGETGRIQADLDRIDAETKVQKMASKEKYLGVF